MSRTLPSIIGGLAIIVILGLYMVTYQVRFNEVAVIRTFGTIMPPEPVRLFAVPVGESREALEAGTVPDAVRQAFVERQEPLSDEVTCSVPGQDVVSGLKLPENVESMWRLTDGSRRYLLTVAKDAEEIVVGDLGNLVSGDVKTKPGLYWKWPWPIQRVQTYDNRIHMTETLGEEMPTADEKNIIVTTAVGWRIAEPYKFSVNNHDMADAQEKLKTQVRNDQKTVIGKCIYNNFVSTDPAVLQYDRIEKDILEAVRDKARDLYGMDVEFIGFKRLALPEQVTENVFSAMKEEKNALAASYTAAGESEAARIEAEAKSIAETILAFANLKAKDIVAEGKRRAAESNRTFAQDEPLAVFLLQMDYLAKILKDRTTIILDNKPPFDLLVSNGVATSQPAGAPAPGGVVLPELIQPE